MAVADLYDAAPLPRTIDELTRTQAKLNPDNPVVAYPSSGTNYVDYSLRQLDAFALRTAQKYAKDLPSRTTSAEKATVVALLGISSFDYLVTMLALTKLGHTVLLMSPRISQPAYAHLLAATGARCVVYQAQFREKVVALRDADPELAVIEAATQGYYGGPVTAGLDTYMTPQLDLRKETLSVAWIFHSSGSTGLPKPIFITHKAALGNYRRNMDHLGFRSFLTLPLFHTHGISSLFRAFITGQVVHIYNASLPLTKQHLITCMREHEFDIFCTVPYALKVLYESEEGVELLRRFRLVTFGGAPCPDPLGDALTERGVKLVTVYGMGECGPLMTSWRPDGDDAWSYCRVSAEGQKHLTFEDRGEGLYELICGVGWPSRVASNRPDGSYATRDLFVKHPTLNAWKYSGRIDDLIVLENGEKANPLPIEGAVRQHALVAEAVVFGAGKPHFGIAIIRAPEAAGLAESEFVERVFPLVEESQEVLPAYAKISRDMVLVLPPDTVYPRTDKGTVIRKAFYKVFGDDIDEAYVDKKSTQLRVLSEPELKEFIRAAVKSILYLTDEVVVTDDQDFFGLGMDSLQASQLRALLVKDVDTGDQKLDLNVVFDFPSVSLLASKVHSLASGAEITSVSIDRQMEMMIEKYSDFQKFTPRPRESTDLAAVLTGATGSLGAHTLAELCRLKNIQHVYCLVRATSEQEARLRVVRSLQERRVYDTLSLQEREKIVCIAASLSQPSLGISSAIYDEITAKTVAVYHCAWSVNFNVRLSSMEDCVAGLKNLLDLCSRCAGDTPAKFMFCSSVGTVLRTTERVVPESVPTTFSSAQPTGYAQSKLVSEVICSRAMTQTAIPTYVLRVGQIVGDTKFGIWNVSEAIPLMLETARTLRTLPSIDESLRWLPVDTVAQAIIEITNSSAKGGVFNVVNPRTFHWTRDLLPALKNAGLEFDVVDPPSWLNLLRGSESDPAKNPSIKLLDYLTVNYDSTEPRRTFDFETGKATSASDALRAVMPPDEELIGKIVRHLRSSWGVGAEPVYADAKAVNGHAK